MPKRVLVADDDANTRDSMQHYFESIDCTVDTGSNYIGVRELIDNHTYDLILCDNGMPLGGEQRPHRTCGLQLLAHAKLGGPNKDTPFVIHTGDDNAETKRVTEEVLGGIYKLKASRGLLEFLASLLQSA